MKTAARRSLRIVMAACLTIFLSMVSSSVAGAETRFYRVEGMVESAEPELKGVRMMVPWISTSTENAQIQIRLVFRNVSSSQVSAFGLMAPRDYVLSVSSGDLLHAQARSESLAIVIPPDGLAPTQSNAGMVTFVPKEQTMPVGATTLHVSRYDSLSFTLTPSREFSPPPFGKLLPVNQELRSQHDAMSLVALDVESVMVTPDGKMAISLAFRNTGRANLKINTRLTGKDARIVDGELNVRSPDDVSPALENNITPESGVLPAGTPHSGTVRFTLAHPVAAEQWQLFYPGYERMGAQWNAKKGSFDVKVLASPAVESAATDGGGTLAAEEKRFHGIKALLERLEVSIDAGDAQAYLAGLPPHLRESHARLMGDRATVGARGLDFHLPPVQRFEAGGDGVVRNVKVMLRYQLDDGSDRNRMIASADASFVSDKGNWRIVDFRFTKAAPFWLLGYVTSKETEHFKIFYRAGTASADRIDKAGRQLEKAYRSLKRKGVPVEAKSYAIFLDKAADFATVAGIGADRFDGAAMLHYEKVGDGFKVRNRMIYINDAQFVTGERLWGMRERQATITHELVHLYLSKDSRPWIPSWVTEGIAVHFAGQYNSWSRRALRQNPNFESTTLAELSARHTLSEGSQNVSATQAAYFLSGEAFDVLEKKVKARKLLEFFRSFASYDLQSIRTVLAANGVALSAEQAPGVVQAGPILTDILLKQYFGTDLAALDAAVKRKVRKRGF